MLFFFCFFFFFLFLLMTHTEPASSSCWASSWHPHTCLRTWLQPTSNGNITHFGGQRHLLSAFHHTHTVLRPTLSPGWHGWRCAVRPPQLCTWFPLSTTSSSATPLASRSSIAPAPSQQQTQHQPQKHSKTLVSGVRVYIRGNGLLLTLLCACYVSLRLRCCCGQAV